MYVMHGSQRIDYRIIKSDRKTVSVVVDPTDGVIIRAPQKVDDSQIQEIVKGKAPWILGKLKNNSSKIVTVDAAKLAIEAGSALSANVVMLGAAFATGILPIKKETMKEVIETHFTKSAKQINLKAFELGYEVSQEALE